MKNEPGFPWKEAAALMGLTATPLSAQSLTTGYSNTLGLGAAGGIILLLLAWANRLRRQLRGQPQAAAVSHGPPAVSRK